MLREIERNVAIICVFVLSISNCSYAANRILPQEHSTTDRIVLEYNFNKPIVAKSGQYDSISVEGLQCYRVPGAPVIPICPVKILIPFGKKVVSIKANTIESLDLPGSYSLAPGQKPYPRTHTGPIAPAQPDPNIYSLNSNWPGTYYKEFSTQFKRGYQILILNLFPVQYVPAAGKISYATKLRVEVELAATTEKAILRPTNQLISSLKKDVSNPSALDSYPSDINEVTDIGAGKDLRRVRSPIKAQRELDGLLSSVRGKTSKDAPRISKTKDSYLRFLGAPPSAYFPVEAGKFDNPEQMAGTFLSKQRNFFVNESAAVSFDKIRVKSQGPRTYVRYQQKYAGIPIFGAELIVQVNAKDGIGAVTSDIMRNTQELDRGKVSLSPKMDAVEAKKRAVEWLTAQHKGLQFAASEPKMMIYAPSVVGNRGEAKLVWQTEVGNTGEAIVKENILIDAHRGEIVFHHPLIYNAVYREVWDYNSTPNPVLALVENDGNYPTGINDIDKAYDYLKDTYDFYYTYHERQGYDGNGANSVAKVRYNEDNARWTGTYMRLGNGNATDDIVGHEFTHGVTESESDLTYSGESGAICESFSDMWGEWIDQTNSDGNDISAVKWYLFEDWSGTPWPWRRMDKPSLCCTSITYGSDFNDLPQPETYNDLNFYTGSQDCGGVHHNLGVGNKLSYLLTDGDTFNGYQISGIGIDKTSALFYECQTNLLTSSADYEDLGNALIQASINLADDIGITEAERHNVARACLAVEIYSPPIISDSSCPYYGIGDPNYKYVIVTDEDIAYNANVNDPNYSFHALCKSKQDRGISACIVTTDWIYANYDAYDYDPNNYDSSKPSSNHATEIRMFLMDAYEAWGTEYCLLGGADAIVPARIFYTPAADYPQYPEWHYYASDLYYSCLDRACTFNYDADPNWGGPNDGADGGEIDLSSEVFVGRACIETCDEVRNFVYKTLTYEKSTDAYLNNFSAFSVTLGGDNWMKPYAEYVRVESDYNAPHETPVHRVGFEERTLPKSRDFDTSQHFYDYDYYYADPNNPTVWDPNTTLLPVINGNGYTTPHILYYAGHGGESCILRGGPPPNVPPQWTNIMEVQSNSTPDLDDLTNGNDNRYFFWYLDACLTGRFTCDDCFAEELTVREHGAFAAITSTNAILVVQELFHPDYYPETKICVEFFDSFLDDANIPSLGQALQNARENTIQNEVLYSEVARLSYCEMTLFGDPELVLRVTYAAHNINKNRYYDKIQDAIDDANSNDVIEVVEGTFTGTGNRDLDFKGKAITVRSKDPNDWDVVEATIIDCNGTRSSPHRGFHFHSGEDANSVISGFTIINGYGDVNDGYYAGGAIFCDSNSSPTINRCIIKNNTNDKNNYDVDGGGIACYNGASPQILNCIVRDNTAYYSGAISCWGSDLVMKGCIISGNSADCGGGISCYENGDATIVNCTISKNSADGYGGGGIFHQLSNATITNSIIWANQAGVSGDQIDCYLNCPTIAYTDIQGGWSGTGNINSDPCFVNADANNFHIEPNSPCRDEGDPCGDYTGQTDIDGDPRVMGPFVDIGADEVECYAGMPDYDQWVAAGKPECWCYPRQCHGDADGKTESSGKPPVTYWVGNNDLTILGTSWNKNPGDLGYNGCADFDHLTEGGGKVPIVRVGDNDLNILNTYWKDDSDGGPAPLPDCQPGNSNP